MKFALESNIPHLFIRTYIFYDERNQWEYMYRDLSTEDNLHKNFPDVSSEAGEDDTKQMVEMAAEQLANLIWDHWLYIQRQKKKKWSNIPDS